MSLLNNPITKICVLIQIGLVLIDLKKETLDRFNIFNDKIL